MRITHYYTAIYKLATKCYKCNTLFFTFGKRFPKKDGTFAKKSGSLTATASFAINVSIYKTM